MGDPHQGDESQVQTQDQADGSVATNDSAAARSPPLQRDPSFPWASTNERVQVESAVETQRVGSTIVCALQCITDSDGRFAAMYSGRNSDTLLLGHVFQPLTQWIVNRLKRGEVERQRDMFAYVLWLVALEVVLVVLHPEPSPQRSVGIFDFLLLPLGALEQLLWYTCASRASPFTERLALQNRQTASTCTTTSR